MKVALVIGICITIAIAAETARADSTPPLVLESKIALDHVRGRIDHLTADVARQRLYVAELGNDTVGVVDLNSHALDRTLSGFHEPQGIGYEPTTDTLYVANGGDGAVQLFQGAALTPVGTIALGDDADNVRVDAATHRVLVGYGSGALALIDPTSRKKIADIRLKAHPESFQIDSHSHRIYVNVPDAHQIAVIDSSKGRQTQSWAPEGLRANFPLAIDQDGQHVLVVFRHPPTLGTFDARGGLKLSSIETCGDADDVFVDPKRSRVYVSCGEGYIDVLAEQGDGYAEVARVATSGGARTALFVSDFDRLFLAVRATASAAAAIWVYRPVP
jgi:DNA-binding beta-propeller fold protein YncE